MVLLEVTVTYRCFAFTLLTGLAFIAPAAAQVPCGDRDEIIRMLSEKYRETPHAYGVANQSSLVEIYTSKAGTWTILVSRPKGSSCIVGTGQSWEDLPAQKEFTGL